MYIKKTIYNDGPKKVELPFICDECVDDYLNSLEEDKCAKCTSDECVDDYLDSLDEEDELEAEKEAEIEAIKRELGYVRKMLGMILETMEVEIEYTPSVPYRVALVSTKREPVELVKAKKAKKVKKTK